MISPRRHARLAKTLIEACGGTAEAAEMCRLEKSQLYNAANPNHDSLLPIDVIADLESYCGEPHYSRALVEAVGAGLGSGDLIGEAFDFTARAAKLGSEVHKALVDDVLSGHEQDSILELTTSARDALTRLESDVERNRKDIPKVSLLKREGS